MTEHDERTLTKLLSTLLKEIKLHEDDSQIIKAIVFNHAIEESINIIQMYSAGTIDPDLLRSL